MSRFQKSPNPRPPKEGPPQTTEGDKRAFDMRPKPSDRKNHEPFDPTPRARPEPDAELDSSDDN